MKDYRKKHLLEEFSDIERSKAKHILTDFRNARNIFLPNKEYKEHLYSCLEALRYNKESHLELIKKYFSSALAFTFIISVVWLFYTQTDVVIEPISEDSMVSQWPHQSDDAGSQREIYDASELLETWITESDIISEQSAEESIQNTTTDALSVESENTYNDWVWNREVKESHTRIIVPESEVDTHKPSQRHADIHNMSLSEAEPSDDMNEEDMKEESNISIYTDSITEPEIISDDDDILQSIDMYDPSMGITSLETDSYLDIGQEDKQIFQEICLKSDGVFVAEDHLCILNMRDICGLDALRSIEHNSCSIFYREYSREKTYRETLPYQGQ